MPLVGDCQWATSVAKLRCRFARERLIRGVIEGEGGLIEHLENLVRTSEPQLLRFPASKRLMPAKCKCMYALGPNAFSRMVEASGNITGLQGVFDHENAPAKIASANCRHSVLKPLVLNSPRSIGAPSSIAFVLRENDDVLGLKLLYHIRGMRGDNRSGPSRSATKRLSPPLGMGRQRDFGFLHHEDDRLFFLQIGDHRKQCENQEVDRPRTEPTEWDTVTERVCCNKKPNNLTGDSRA